MVIPGPCMGIIRFEHSSYGVVVASRIEFIAVPVPGVRISSLPGICGLQFEYSGGSGVAAGNGVKGMAILIPGLVLYSSLFMSWAAGGRVGGGVKFI